MFFSIFSSEFSFLISLQVPSSDNTFPISVQFSTQVLLLVLVSFTKYLYIVSGLQERQLSLLLFGIESHVKHFHYNLNIFFPRLKFVHLNMKYNYFG